MKVILLKMQSRGFSPCKQRVTFLPSHWPRLWKHASHAWSITLGTCQAGHPKPGQGTQKWGSDGHLSVRSIEVHITQTRFAHTPIYKNIKRVASDVARYMLIRFPPLSRTFFRDLIHYCCGMHEIWLLNVECEHDNGSIKQMKMQLLNSKKSQDCSLWSYNMTQSTSWFLQTLNDGLKNTLKSVVVQKWNENPYQTIANRMLKCSKCNLFINVTIHETWLSKTDDIQSKSEKPSFKRKNM